MFAHESADTARAQRRSVRDLPLRGKFAMLGALTDEAEYEVLAFVTEAARRSVLETVC
jgi:DNA-nicking Smr family endonuclease